MYYFLQPYDVFPSSGQRQDGYSNGIRSTTGRFAIGVVAIAALSPNQTLTIRGGMQPQIGKILVVSHGVFFLLVLGLLVGPQGLGFLIAAFWGNSVPVQDERVFAKATLLKLILERLEDHVYASRGLKFREAVGDGRRRSLPIQP